MKQENMNGGSLTVWKIPILTCYHSLFNAKVGIFPHIHVCSSIYCDGFVPNQRAKIEII